MGRSRGVTPKPAIQVMRRSFEDADQNAQNDSAGRPDAGSFLTGSLVARQERLTERMSSQHRSRHMYARRSDFDCT
jgi:hypothetical protein